MKVSGSATLNATVQQVWSVLQDPGVLVGTIPGCQQLETTGQDEYRMTVSAGVASIKGTYLGNVRLAEQQPPHAYTLLASGQGAPGTVDARARVTLVEVEDGRTRLDYDADAVVGGPIGGVGQRVLAGVAKKMAGEFFAAVDRHLVAGTTVSAPEVPAVPEVPATAASLTAARATAARAIATYTRSAEEPAARTTGSSADRLGWLAAGAAGAAIALAGVWVGARLSRRR